MKRIGKDLLVILFGGLASLWIFCEFLIYYLVIYAQCTYPDLKPGQGEALTAMFLADTHLLGSRNGHWFDKLRREWQMHRAFVSANAIFAPELIVFLGDVFDEGKWCGPEEFEYYVSRFKDLFPVDDAEGGDEAEESGQKVKVVAGNHDMGFHYQVTPYLNSRFEESMGTGGAISRFALKGVQFVTANSMALEGDECFLCEEARNDLEKVKRQLECLETTEEGGKECELDYDFEGLDNDRGNTYSPPILLQHFPLFRYSDALCQEFDEAPKDEKVKPFREEWDCLSENSSDHLVRTIKPRLVLSGHTHHGCVTNHRVKLESKKKLTFDEWSVSSFSWRNRNNPTFLLAKFTNDDFAISKCFLPREDMVINLYICGAILILLALINRACFTGRRAPHRKYL